MNTIGIAAAASGTVSLAAMFRTVRRRWHRLLNPYRPELHYMRGPGPKCREKQARAERGL